jgi:sporulation protein YlmC with PRC-barrel domain
MELSEKQLIGLPVYTVSGIYLGKICELYIQPETQMIKKYLVSELAVLGKPLSGKKLVSSEQVVSLSAEKMLVIDLLATLNTEIPSAA